MKPNAKKIPVLIIAGPTASGKSKLALEYAQNHNGVIINADSMQVYKELPILTAQPSPKEMELVPHKLYGILSGDDPCSVARWQRLALQAIAECAEMGKPPIIVGGTGMYISALLSGIAAIPEVSSQVRSAVRTLHQQLGADDFYKELQQLDPEMAKRLHPGDTQRVVRAFEVIKATGRSLLEWQGESGKDAVAHLDCTVKLLTPDKEKLRERANQRFVRMVANGAVEEAKLLLSKNYDPNMPVMKALGVPELSAYLQGTATLEEAIELAQIATRQYIKRQLTWFRKQERERLGKP